MTLNVGLEKTENVTQLFTFQRASQEGEGEEGRSQKNRDSDPNLPNSDVCEAPNSLGV